MVVVDNNKRSGRTDGRPDRDSAACIQGSNTEIGSRARIHGKCAESAAECGGGGCGFGGK